MHTTSTLLKGGDRMFLRHRMIFLVNKKKKEDKSNVKVEKPIITDYFIMGDQSLTAKQQAPLDFDLD